MPTDDDTEEEELSDELLEIEEVLLDIDETDDEELFGFAGIAGIAGIARLVFCCRCGWKQPAWQE